MYTKIIMTLWQVLTGQFVMLIYPGILKQISHIIALIPTDKIKGTIYHSMTLQFNYFFLFLCVVSFDE